MYRYGFWHVPISNIDATKRSYGVPKGRATCQYLSDNIYTTIDNILVTLGDHYVTVDNNYAMIDNYLCNNSDSMIDNNHMTIMMR